MPAFSSANLSVACIATAAWSAAASAQNCGTWTSMLSRQANDHAGAAVAVSGNWMFMGIPDDDNSDGVDAGGLLSLQYSGGTWNEGILYHPSSLNAGDKFGSSVSMHGVWAVAGAPYHDANGTDSGLAFIYKLNNNVWSAMSVLSVSPAPTAKFGSAVSVHGNLMLIGAPEYDSAWQNDGYVLAQQFNAATQTWEPLPVDVNADPGPQHRTGTSVCAYDSPAGTGDLLIAGAPTRSFGQYFMAGFVQFQERSAAGWGSNALVPPMMQENLRFGTSVATDGTRIYVGAPGADLPGADGAGIVYVFQRVDLYWQHTGTIQPPYPMQSAAFGQNLACDPVTGVLLISDANGVVYRSVNGQPVGAAISQPGTFEFGKGLAISVDKMVIGDPGYENGAATDAGGVRTYVGIPDNDLPSNATTVNVYDGTLSTYWGCTVMARNNGEASCASTARSNDVWFALVNGANESRQVRIDTIGSGFDTVLSVHAAPVAAPANTIACDDDSGGNLASLLEITVPANSTRWARLAGFDIACGGYEFSVEVIAPTQCPADIQPQPAGDGLVNIDDLLAVISAWGGNGASPANINGDSTVNIDDLLAVISAWGACP